MEPQAKQLTLNSFFSILWRQRYAMVAIVILCLVAGYVIFKRTPLVWESTAELMIQGHSQNSSSSSSDPMNQGNLPEIDLDIPSQIEVIQSQTLLTLIYDKAGLSMPEYMTVEQRAALPQIRVEQVGSTNAVRVSVDSSDIALADEVAHLLPIIFDDYVQALQQGRLRNAVQYLKDRLSTETGALSKAQADFDNFKMKRTLVPVENEAGYRTQRVTSTQAELTGTQTGVAAAQERLNGLMRERANLPKTLKSDTTATNNAQIDSEKQAIAELNVQREALLIRELPDNMDVRLIDAQIKAHQQHLATLPKVKAESSTTRYPAIIEMDARIATARIDLRAAQVLELRAEEQAAKARREFDEYNKIAPRQNDLAQIVSDRRAAVLATTRSLEQLQVVQSSTEHPVKTLEPPTVPTKVRPKGIQYMSLAFFMGLFLAVGFALTKDSMEDRLASADEVYDLTGLPSLGEIPALSSRLPSLVEGTIGEGLLESYRMLRFNIAFSTLESPVKSIVVTSSGPGEGKTELACNLAIAASGAGRRVILVDANLRNPMIHKKMNVAGKPGLSDVVLGEADLKQSLHLTSIPGLRVLTCGSLTSTPVELLSSPQMRDVYKRLAADSDLVIFDAPTCLGFADTQILSNVAESVLFVARSGKTKRLAVRKGIDTLRQANARVLGVATSGANVKVVKS